MWYEFFRFEINYRMKRPETYLFFLFLFLFSLFAVEFVFQGTDLGLVKKNSALVIAKSMAAITALSMMIASMIMGTPVLRDFQYDVTSLIYVNPISKKHYLIGRFLGSFVVLLFIFSAVLWGMMLGEYMPWTDQRELMPFQFANYLQPFLWVALPTLFFGASVFFITGALSKKLMVVYTQGVVVFVLFLLAKNIPNETLQALLDPFSLTTLSIATEHWTVNERNSALIPFSGIMLVNKFLWIAMGISALAIGYLKFQLIVLSEKTRQKNQLQKPEQSTDSSNRSLPGVNPTYDLKAQLAQLFLNAWFHSLSILKLTSFWAIIVCCFVVIIVNSVSLGTSYGVDSYPATYLIIEELREMSIYFFLIILVFYSGEVMWKEKDAKLDLIHDATPLNRLVNLGSRFLGLMLIFTIVILSLIVAGILFQTVNGYYRYELELYFYGFFLELFPFLALYTLVALFFQAVTGNKFMGIIASISFAILSVAFSKFGLEHPLLNFGGHALASYSDMNGYGHFLTPYLWVKSYWLLFGLLLLLLSTIMMAYGTENSLKKRWKRGRNQFGKPQLAFGLVCFVMFIGTGAFIFYNTNILNEYWTKETQTIFRADYEKSLKQFEYTPQPKIVDVNLNIDLFPSKRAYEINGYYIITNTSTAPIREIHLQKLIASKAEVRDVSFDRKFTINRKYEKYYYSIFELSQPLSPGDTMKMNFRQSYYPKGFDIDDSEIEIVYNGTFFDNTMLPGFGYQKKYELQDEDDRKKLGLALRIQKANRADVRELDNARSGSDSHGTTLETIISTEAPQTALAAGDLVKKWKKNGRNYFHYKTDQQIIHFYPVLSANYNVMRDTCTPAGNPADAIVDLEIYYQKGHESNLDRMLEAMKMSLNYYSVHFSPYQYKHLRIVEFPRYRTFAQSLPGIIPFSESSGFVMDIQDKKDVDMAFFITAHEVAHQWWGMQLEAANVQGQNMILETLAQYSALMLLKQKYPAEKLQKFLQFQREAYREGSLKSKKKELPLALVENESHIYYNKGVLNMHKLQEHIGEEKVNLALRHFLNDWHSFNNPKKPNRYATTLDLVQYFREVTPDSLQRVITELFKQTKPIR
jgi:ABC-2 type transport system permease protein